MEFNIDNIGKFVEFTPHRYSTSHPFKIIMGYDFIRNVYIAGEIDIIPSLYAAVKPLSKDVVFYSLDEALSLIDEKINNENEKISKLEKIVNFDKISQMKENHQNEFISIFNAYREICGQINILKKLISHTSNPRDSKINKLYRHELSKTEKALRRINKRYHFFFGDNAATVQETVLKNDFYSNPYTTRKQILSAIKKYEDEKMQLRKTYERIPLNIKNTQPKH